MSAERNPEGIPESLRDLRIQKWVKGLDPSRVGICCPHLPQRRALRCVQCPKRTFRFSRDSAPGPARPTGAPGVPCLPADCASARTEVEFPPQNHSYENREKRQCTACTAKEASMYTYVLSRSSEVYSCSIKEQRMYRTPR